MLRNFVATRPEFAGAEIIEFCDDGRTGTNFERTGVSKMLDAAKRGQINCIIVKDLSRFGRDYIEVGDYLEQIFPFLGIRFIAINDNYDSIDHPYGSAGLIDVSFKNVIYDLYSKELSEKVRSAKRQLAEKGYFLSPYAFYGYEKAPGSKHELMIDESTAVYVRELFERALNGESTTELARDSDADDGKTTEERHPQLEQQIARQQYMDGFDYRQDIKGRTIYRLRRFREDETRQGRFG